MFNYYISVLDILKEQCEKYGDKIAVIEEKEDYTYLELNQVAMSVGTGIAKISRPHTPVVILMEKSFNCLATMYGALYSGCFYVPVDIKNPIERIRSILNVLGQPVIVTDKQHEFFQKDIEDMNLRTLYFEDLINSKVDTKLLNSIKKNIIDTDIMYIIFTSGSTGSPKGVTISNKSVIDYIHAFCTELEIENNEVWGNQAPFYTDFSLRDIFGALLCGGTLCIIPQKYFMSPKKLLSFIDEKRVTILSWVPTAYRIVWQFNGFKNIKPDTLRKFIFSGEVMPNNVFEYWKEAYPKATFIQCYGPTEATGAASYYFVNLNMKYEGNIPIGKAFRNSRFLLINSNFEEVSNCGEIGEICISGTCLAIGYYNNEEKTKESFVIFRDHRGYDHRIYRTGDLGYYNEDEDLVFVSRKDYQVKHCGKRIELGEIEAAANNLEMISACCCVKDEKLDEIVLFYEGQAESKEIMIGLKERLPRYMIPTKAIKKDRLPILSNGKLDRKTLWNIINKMNAD